MLCEKDSRLGGKLLLAAVPPYKEEIMKLVDFLSFQIKKLGIRIEQETEVTPQFLKRYKPDVVILATGSIPVIPKISGIDRKNVVIAEDVLGHKVEIGSRIAVLGGGQVGCEVAAFLANRGKKVIVVEMLDALAADLGKRQGRQFLIDYLTEKGVILLTQMKGEEISDQGLVVIDKNGQRQMVEVDTVALACGSIPDTGLFESLKRIAPEIHVAGDCAKTRTVLGAIDEAARIARLI
jgi:pyruvate/2-oxoglutarate dehydrogenase complex dihydrolipoamide dehydrogenase (E3) component